MSLCIIVSLIFTKNGFGETVKCSPRGEQTISSLSKECNQTARLAFVNGDIKSLERACNLAIQEEERLKHQDERLIYPLLQLAYSYFMTGEHQKEALALFERVVTIRRGLYSPGDPCLDEFRETIEQLRSSKSKK